VVLGIAQHSLNLQSVSLKEADVIMQTSMIGLMST